MKNNLYVNEVKYFEKKNIQNILLNKDVSNKFFKKLNYFIRMWSKYLIT